VNSGGGGVRGMVTWRADEKRPAARGPEREVVLTSSGRI